MRTSLGVVAVLSAVCAAGCGPSVEEGLSISVDGPVRLTRTGEPVGAIRIAIDNATYEETSFDALGEDNLVFRLERQTEDGWIVGYPEISGSLMPPLRLGPATYSERVVLVRGYHFTQAPIAGSYRVVLFGWTGRGLIPVEVTTSNTFEVIE